MANPRSKMRVTHALLDEYAEKYKNWGRWGADDEIGTLNFTSQDDVVNAASLVKKGKVMSMGLNYDQFGPQGAKTPYPAMGRFNPIHMMTRTGTDAYSGVLDHRGIRGADDLIMMPLQCGTQWDGLGHVFFKDWMWNGYDCREVTTAGAQKAGIEKTKAKMTGRGVFLDMPRVKGVEYLEDGYPITCDDLEEACEKQGVEVRQGDFVVLRTGHMERCLKDGTWDGYAGGASAGMAFETLDWIYEKKIAGYCSDTWGNEVRPCETDENINQPWHWIAIPIMGLTMGEIFYLKDIADDCAEDKVYEFLFVAPALPITGAVGSPVNPLAIK
jgi:kynurenine formamidase